MNKNLLALSLAAASAMAFSASAAVSSNIVGYVKLGLKKGYNLISNPLNNTNTDGNKASSLFTPLGTCSVLRWTGTGFAGTDFFDGVGILDPLTDFVLAPGQAVFVDVPADISWTTVGEALVGLQTVDVQKGNAFVASKIPLAGPATSTLGLTPQDGDNLLTWDNTLKKYVSYSYFAGWLDGEPSIDVGQGFVLQTGAAFVWSKTFTP